MPVINFEYFLYLIYSLPQIIFSYITDDSLRTNALDYLNTWWWISFALTLIFGLGSIIFMQLTFRLWREQHERVYGKPANVVEEIKENLGSLKPQPVMKNKTWEKIVDLMSSDNPNDWKLAVIEADKMLEQVVSTFAVPGDNLGEKMKNIERGDFINLDSAWTAHKVRNRIAHEHNFHLGQREAQTAIGNYEKVFREFDFI